MHKDENRAYWREEQVQNRRFTALYQSFPLTLSERTLDRQVRAQEVFPSASTGLKKNGSSGAAGGPGTMAGSGSVWPLPAQPALSCAQQHIPAPGNQALILPTSKWTSAEREAEGCNFSNPSGLQSRSRDEACRWCETSVAGGSRAGPAHSSLAVQRQWVTAPWTHTFPQIFYSCWSTAKPGPSLDSCVLW